MSVEASELLDPWQSDRYVRRSNTTPAVTDEAHSDDSRSPEGGPSRNVLAVVEAILGYDISSAKAELMAEGYREFGEESVAISEASLSLAQEAFDTDGE